MTAVAESSCGPAFSHGDGQRRRPVRVATDRLVRGVETGSATRGARGRMASKPEQHDAGRRPS